MATLQGAQTRSIQCIEVGMRDCYIFINVTCYNTAEKDQLRIAQAMVGLQVTGRVLNMVHWPCREGVCITLG